jgi:cytochrome P450
VESFRPSAPVPPARPLGLRAFFRALNANPVTAWPETAYREPFVHLRGRGVLPDTVLVTDPAMLHRIFVEAVAVYDKGDVVRRRLRPALGDGLLIAAAESWRPQRRIAAPLFQARRMEAFLPAMVDAAARARDRLEALAQGSIIDMHAAMSRLTYEVIARTAFSSDGVSDPEAFSHAIAGYFDTLGRVDLASFLNLPAWVPTPGRLRARPALALFRREIGRVVDARRARLEREGAQALPDDLLTRMLTVPDPQTGQVLPRARVYDNTMTFLAAGHETTANTVCWILYLLSQSPEWDARVAAELAGVAGEMGPAFADLAGLPVTRAVIDETLRLYPPAPLIPRMATTADRLGPLDLRKGTIVFTSPYVSHRHRLRWDDPDAFRPERFLPAGTSAPDRFVYFPFGAGPRVCIGATFAIQEILVVLAALLPRLRFVATRPQDVFPRATITLKPGDTLPMRVERRR